MTLFASLLPEEVRSAESFTAPPDPGGQHDLGRRLLAQLLGPGVIPRGSRGEPLWPPDVTGSITHTREYAAVAVASSLDCAGIGIDAEPAVALPPDAIPVVSNPAEQQRLSRVTPRADTLAFVAKEAVFKAWWPLHREELDFAEVDLTVERDGTLLARHPTGRWPVRWRHSTGLILAAVTVPSQRRQRS